VIRPTGDTEGILLEADDEIDYGPWDAVHKRYIVVGATDRIERMAMDAAFRRSDAPPAGSAELRRQLSMLRDELAYARDALVARAAQRSTPRSGATSNCSPGGDDGFTPAATRTTPGAEPGGRQEGAGPSGSQAPKASPERTQRRRGLKGDQRQHNENDDARGSRGLCKEPLQAATPR
jgi:hypothetical protein